MAAPHDAADIAQEAMIRAWRSLRDGTVPEHPIAWLRTIVHREAHRHRARNAAAISLDEHGDVARSGSHRAARFAAAPGRRAQSG